MILEIQAQPANPHPANRLSSAALYPGRLLNQTERTNRFITETLRSIVNESGASVRDWAKYVKFIEFAIRRAPIPGTNLTPFMAMRGREPVLPIDLPLVSQAPSSNDTLDDHVKRLKQTLTTATKLVKSAMERTKEKNKDLHALSSQKYT